MTGSSFYAAAVITVSLQQGSSRYEIQWAFLWAFAYALVALALLVATLASFNRCLGRVETGLFSSGHRP